MAVSRLRSRLPGWLTTIRLLLAVPIGLAILGARDGAALALLGLAAVTDLLDGSLARRWGTASDRGARFDVWADFTVISAAFLSLGRRGIYGYWPVAVSALLFAQFLVSSRRGELRYDPVGRAYGGILLGMAGLTLALLDTGVQAVLLASLLIVSAIVLAGRNPVFLARWRVEHAG